MESRKARPCPAVRVECAELRIYVAANDVAKSDVAKSDVTKNEALRCGAAPCAAL